MSQAGEVFAEYIKFYVDDCTNLYVAEIGILPRVRNDGYTKGVIGGANDSKRHPINSHGTLVDCEVSPPGHLHVSLVTESEIGAAIGIIHGHTGCSLIYVSLYNVSVEASVHDHGPLYVDLVTHA